MIQDTRLLETSRKGDQERRLFRHLNFHCQLVKPENRLLHAFSEVVREINTRVNQDFFCAPGYGNLK